MKTNSSIIRYANKSDYLNRKPMDVEGASKLGQDASKSLAGEKSQVQGPDQPQKKVSQLKEAENRIKGKVSEVKDVGSHLLGQAVSAASKMVSLPTSIPGLPEVDLGGTKSVNAAKAPKTPIHKPGIFFIEGFSINPFASEENGLKMMAGSIPSSEVFKWSQENEIIEAVKQRATDQPIMLIGYGMGGDTAVSVANKLNSAEGSFRTVDLLVTLDSIGTDNDIIPQNVKKNFNVISDQDTLFNDGPNVARRSDKTLVVNQLTEESHSEIENSPEVQFEVFDHINSVLMDVVKKKNLKQAQEQMTLEQAKVLMNTFQTPSLASSISGQSLLSDM